jgi:hypothetical protein
MRKRHWGAIIAAIIATGVLLLVVLAMRDSAAHEREQHEALAKYEGKSFGELFPSSYSGRRLEGESVEQVTVNGKTLRKGMTWDSALPLLDFGQRLANEKLGDDVFIEVRRFKQGTFSFTFARSNSAYFLTSMENGTYFKDIRP